MNRRRILRGIGAGTATLAGFGSAEAADVRAQSDASLTVEDQATDGDSIVLAELRMPVDGELIVSERADHENTMFAQVQIGEGTYDDYELELDRTIEESQSIRVWVFDGPMSEDGDVIASDAAYVSVGGEMDVDVLGVTYVESDPEYGFNYPYYLYTPPPGDFDEHSILVEPNNTGTSSDDFEVHREAVKAKVEGGTTRRVSDGLGVPLLVPVFPRPRSEPVDYHHYVHALDDTTMAIEDGDLERVDLQLLRMATHAKEEVLADTSYSFRDEIMLNGFSASGNFVDRFAVLHPDRVLSVTAGGLNGMALLPIEEAEGHRLRYHVGIADVESLTGKPVDLEALDDVDQFLYMGGRDGNDTIPFDGPWTDDELRQVALDVYGEDIIADRFPRCQEAYETAGVDAQFRVYEGVAHTPRPAEDDILAFHRRSLEGEPVDDFGQELVAEARFEATSESPNAGEDVTFDAGDSAGGIDGITNYLWEFGDGESAIGERVTHAFEEPGEYVVTLTIVLENGNEKSVTKTVVVSEAATDSTESDSEGDDGSNTTTESDGEADSSGTNDSDEDESSDSTPDEGDTSTSGASDAPESRGDGDSSESENDDSEGSENDDSEESENDEPPSGDETGDAAGDSQPGFGVASAVGSLGGIGYLLKRRLEDG